MSDPPPAPAARRTTRRLPIAFARLVARLFRRAGTLTSILLGSVSLLIAFSAYQASDYSDRANELDSLANKMSVDNVNQSQRDYAEHAADLQLWAQIEVSGEDVDLSPLRSLLSERWRDAMERTAADPNFAGGIPIDDRYWQELTVETRAYEQQIRDAYDDARTAGATSSRLTGVSVVYSAALLLLTVAVSTVREPVKLALNGVALVIITLAILIGLAPLRVFL